MFIPIPLYDGTASLNTISGMGSDASRSQLPGSLDNVIGHIDDRIAYNLRAHLGIPF